MVELIFSIMIFSVVVFIFSLWLSSSAVFNKRLDDVFKVNNLIRYERAFERRYLREAEFPLEDRSEWTREDYTVKVRRTLIDERFDFYESEIILEYLGSSYPVKTFDVQGRVIFYDTHGI